MVEVIILELSQVLEVVVVLDMVQIKQLQTIVIAAVVVVEAGMVGAVDIQTHQHHTLIIQVVALDL